MQTDPSLDLAKAISNSFVKFGPNCATFLRKFEKQLRLPSKQTRIKDQMQFNTSGLDQVKWSKVNAEQMRKLSEYDKLKKNLEKKRRKHRKYGDDGRPKRPKNAFLFFLQDQKPNIIRQYPELKTTRVVCLAAEKYRTLTEQQKQPYLQKYHQQKAIYDKKQQYHKNLPRPRLPQRQNLNKNALKMTEQAKRPQMDKLKQLYQSLENKKSH